MSTCIQLPLLALPRTCLLVGYERESAIATIKQRHYTRSVPSGKSWYVRHQEAIIIWSIPANNQIAHALLGYDASVWELSRLWAPDGHERNLLTQAISAAVKMIERLEHPDCLISYADPNAGHHGGVYKAASWLHHGTSTEVRAYRARDGRIVARRAFHSGDRHMNKAEIEERGFTALHLPGKERFVKPLSKRARRVLAVKP